MLNTVDEIIAGFEQALELERELGTRYVEMPAPTHAQASMPEHQVSAPVNQAPIAGERLGGTPSPCHQSTVANQPINHPPPPNTQHPTPNTQHPAPNNPITDFAFIAQQYPQGSAAELLGKMVAAMGYAMNQVTVVTADSAVAMKPVARVYVVMGSDAFRTFAPGQRAALGLWTVVNDVPTIVTYSPARILSYFGNDAAGLTKAKRQIWSDLKSALARIGKQPPAAKR